EEVPEPGGLRLPHQLHRERTRRPFIRLGRRLQQRMLVRIDVLVHERDQLVAQGRGVWGQFCEHEDSFLHERTVGGPRRPAYRAALALNGSSAFSAASRSKISMDTSASMKDVA